MNLNHISDHVEIYREAKRRISELEDMAKRSRAVIEEEMGDSEVGVIDGKVVVTWKIHKAKRLNQKYLKEMYPEVFELCSEINEYRKMEVQ